MTEIDKIAEGEKKELEEGLKRMVIEAFKKEFGVDDIFSEEPTFEPVPWPGGKHELIRHAVVLTDCPDQVLSISSFNKGGGIISVSLRVLQLNKEQFFQYQEPGADKIDGCLANALYSLRKEARINPANSRIQEVRWSKNDTGTKFIHQEIDNETKRKALLQLIKRVQSGSTTPLGKREYISFVANR